MGSPGGVCLPSHLGFRTKSLEQCRHPVPESAYLSQSVLPLGAFGNPLHCFPQTRLQLDDLFEPIELLNSNCALAQRSLLLIEQRRIRLTAGSRATTTDL
jgi:hypothetical protein